MTQLIDSSVRLPESYLKRASWYAALKKYNLAFDDLDASIKLDSGNVLTYFVRANTNYSLLRLMISLDTTSNFVIIGSATQLNQNLQDRFAATYQTILKGYSRAIELDPDFPFAYYNRGIVYTKMGEYRKAADDFSNAIRSMSNFPEAYFNRGLLLFLLNENLEGCEDLSHAGELGILDAYRVIKRYCYK